MSSGRRSVPIRARLAFFGLLVVALTLLVFSLVFYGLFAAAGSNTQDQELAERAQQAMASLERADAQAFQPRAVPASLDISASTDVFFLVLGPEGEPLFATGEVDGEQPRIPADALAGLGEDASLTTLEVGAGAEVRVHLQRWTRPDLGLNGFLAVAQSSRRVDEDLRGGMIFLSAAAIIAFLVAALAIWLVTGRALRPLRDLAVLTREVGLTQDLTRRLPVPAVDDDLGRLSQSFNGMMARLEEARAALSRALDSQTRFVADASHELRTPLTAVRSNAEFLLKHRDAAPEDRQAALGDIQSESERMSRLVENLLILARADGGFQWPKEQIELAPVLEEVARQAGKLHPDRHISASVTSAAVHANEDALRQLLWILVDNAVRHTREGGSIRITSRLEAETAQVSVADDGEGFLESDLEKVFDRFYRSDKSRGQARFGLGLSIARWIVEEHGGGISAHNNDLGGATVLAVFPAPAGVERRGPPENPAAVVQREGETASRARSGVDRPQA